MSAPEVSPLSTATKLELIKSIEARRAAAESSESEETVPPAIPIKPYEVRLRRGVGDTTFVVGHDRAGHPMVELRVRRKHLTPSMVRRMERWCRDHDEPDLHLV
jgi:hypothetical protein